MPGDDGKTQQKRPSSSTKRANPPLIRTPLLIPDIQEQSVRMTEDDDLIGEDTQIGPPRSPNSTVIRNKGNSLGTPRMTDTSATSLVPRRSSATPSGPGTNVLPTPGPLRSPRPTVAQTPQNNKRRRNVHWLVLVGVGMIAMLALWVIGSAAVGWARGISDDWHYGRPRTFQIDAVVGHGGDSKAHPSHFIAVNLNRHILIVEFPAGSPACGITYGGPMLYDSGGDLAPVTLEFKDVNGDGKLDMLIYIESQTIPITFYNDGKQFNPANQTPKPNTCTVTAPAP